MKINMTYSEFAIILRNSGLFLSDKMWVPEEKNERFALQASVRTINGDLLCFKEGNLYKEVTASARSLPALSIELWKIMTDQSKRILVGEVLPGNCKKPEYSSDYKKCIEFTSKNIFEIRNLTPKEKVQSMLIK